MADIVGSRTAFDGLLFEANFQPFNSADKSLFIAVEPLHSAARKSHVLRLLQPSSFEALSQRFLKSFYSAVAALKISYMTDV